MVPTWFVWLNGFAMLILGGALIATRPHKPGDSLYKRFVNFGTLWACLCVGMGVALLSLALGYWSLSGSGTRAGKAKTHWETR